MSPEMLDSQASVPPADAAAAAIGDGLEHRLDPRVILLQRIGGWVFTGVVGGASFLALVAAWITNGASAVGLLAGSLPWTVGVSALAWHAHRWPAIDYRHASYRIDDRSLEIRRGVYWRTVVTVPRSRVQHTDVSQGPLERRFGLGTLVVYTAGTDHARVSLAGLAHERALRIREHLLPRGGDAV
jgi:membrane protein YdbS with pleckstrin-like domain